MEYVGEVGKLVPFIAVNIQRFELTTALCILFCVRMLFSPRLPDFPRTAGIYLMSHVPGKAGVQHQKYNPNSGVAVASAGPYADHSHLTAI